jgi:dipeptidase
MHPNAPEKNAGVRWIGFDCAHWGDMMPYYRGWTAAEIADKRHSVYRGIDYVKRNCESLARALKRMSRES